MPTDFVDVFNNLPGWKDGNRRVELQTASGSIVAGTIDIHDEFFDGENEHPVFTIVTDYGSRVSIHDYEKFRYVDDGSETQNAPDLPGR